MKPTEALPHPAGWNTANVGKVIELRRGVSWAKDQEFATAHPDRVTVLRISNVQERLETDDLLYLSGIPEAVREKKRVSKGWSILVGSNGNRARIGNAVFVTEDSEYLFASFLVAARPREMSGIDPAFFFRWLNTEAVQYRLTSTAEGSTGLSNLSHDFLRRMQISFPNGDEQAAIARILDAADTAIERARVAVEKAERVKTALLQRVFGGSALPRHISEFCKDACYGTSQASNDRGWGYPALRIPNVIGGDFNSSNLTFVDMGETSAKALALESGDALVVRTNGNPAYVGRAAVFDPPDDRIWLFASYLIRLRFSADLSPDYFQEFINSSFGRRELHQRVATSAGNYNLNIRNLRSIRIPWIKPDMQTQAVKLLRAANQTIRATETRVAALERLKRGLMQDLLTGRVRVKTAAALAASV